MGAGHSALHIAEAAGARPGTDEGGGTCNLGLDILLHQQEQGRGANVIERLAQDLRIAFSELEGFSSRTLKSMRKIAEIWPDSKYMQEVLAQLPWYHQKVFSSAFRQFDRIPHQQRPPEGGTTNLILPGATS